MEQEWKIAISPTAAEPSFKVALENLPDFSNADSRIYYSSYLLFTGISNERNRKRNYPYEQHDEAKICVPCTLLSRLSSQNGSYFAGTDYRVKGAKYLWILMHLN